VIQTKNDYDRMIFNGELGIVTHIDERGFVVSFAEHPEERDRRLERSSFSERDQGPTEDLDWGNAITVHKAQGSEFPIVIIPVLASYSIMLLRNLYYTAVSRARRKVIIVGDPEALKRAAANMRGKQRMSKLAEFLNPEKDWPSCAPDMEAIDYTELERTDDNSPPRRSRYSDEEKAAALAIWKELMATGQAEIS
jgi:ATP-dependent exoDNAse (exonuclease V) alpha subunit